MTANSRAWQRALLALCFVALVLQILSVPSFFDAGRFGIASTWTDRPFVLRLLSVVPNSPAASAGLRAGDQIEVNALPAGDRYRWCVGMFRFGERFVLPVERKNRRFDVRVTASLRRDVASPWSYWAGVLGTIWTIVFALVIALRRPDSAEARLLALLLLTWACAGTLSPGGWLTPWPTVDFAASLVSLVLTGGACAFCVAYVMLFARPPGALRRVCAATAYAIAAWYALWYIAPTVGWWTGTIDPNAPLFVNPLWNLISPLWPLLACVALTIRDSHGAERSRLSWAAGPLIAVPALLLAVAFLDDFADTAQFAVDVGDLALFILPLGFAYALFNPRLLDIGFALNRAAVFAVTSLLLAGLFAGLQWLANTALTGLSAHNVFVQLAIAVTVYYIVRFTRHHTEQLVGRVLFAKRQRRITAMRALVHHIDEVNEPDGIAPFVVESLRTVAEVDAVVLLQREDGTFGPFDASETPALARDDRTIVELRSQREPLPAPAWAGNGAVAFPMLVRGRLRGVLICRSLDGDALAPDENAALFAVAREMASARDDLLAHSLRERLRAYEAQPPSVAALES